MKNNARLKKLLKQLARRRDFQDGSYDISEYLDDCARRRWKLSGKPDKEGYNTSLIWHEHDGGVMELFTDYLDEFEAWLKIQQ